MPRALPAIQIDGPATGPVNAADDSLLLSTDQAFFYAAAKGDAAGVVKLLDADFTWTDANGRTLSRRQLVNTLLPKPALLSEQGAEIRRHNYGDVAVIETHSGKLHVLRIWVKRPAGWRGLVYQEVRSLETPSSITPRGAARDCQNPCRQVPFTPKTAAQRRVLSSYQAFASVGLARDAAAWGAITADEFTSTSANSERSLDKKDGLAELARPNAAGLLPALVVSAEMFEVPGVVIMKSEQQPEHGKAQHATRLWVERDGQWLIALSYETSIQAGQAAP